MDRLLFQRRMLLSLIAVVCSFATVQAEKRTITVTAAGQFASIGSSALSQVDTLILSGPLNGNDLTLLHTLADNTDSYALKVLDFWLSDGYRVETPIGSFAPKLKLLGDHTDPKTIHSRDIVYAGIEFIPSKEFVKEGGKNREGYRKSQAQVGNSQMYDPKAMDEALRRCMKLGYATIPEFMIFSGLKRDSAKSYLDSLCKGDNPRLWKVRESRRWLYFPKRETSKE